MKKWLVILYFFTCNAVEWYQPSATHFSYVFAPGIFASETHMALYCPQFTASTGELISCPCGIQVIRNPVTPVNLVEIELYQPFFNDSLVNNLKKLAWAPLIFLGYAGSSFSIRYYYGIAVQQCAEKKATHSACMHWVNPFKLNVAQDDDIAQLKRAFDSHISILDTPALFEQRRGLILYGVSRGAATIFNFVAQNNPPDVKAVICEGIFDSICGIGTFAKSYFTQLRLALLGLTKFSYDGVAPINLVKKFPHNIPILLISSYIDRTVPYQCTLNLYQHLRKTGHQQVHFLMLSNSRHSLYTGSNEHDKNLYETVVHAFYRAYGLPHIVELADKGQRHFEEFTQPPI